MALRIVRLVFVLLAIGLGQGDSVTGDTISPRYRVAKDGPVKVDVRWLRKPAVLTIGDQVRLQIKVYHPKGISVSQPFNERIEDFAVVNQKHHIEYRGDTAVEVYDLTLAVFLVGEVKLAPFLVAYQEGGEMWVAVSDSIGLSVKSLISEKMSDINDLKPQVNFPNLLPFWILLGVVVAGVGGFLFYRLLRRYRRGAVFTQPELPPWEEALQALTLIPVADWLNQGRVKRLYYTVSEIVKRYLTRRFGFPAIDQTTTEIVRELKVRKIPEMERFSAFFYDADLVKYAKVVPVQPQMVIERAQELVNITRPQEPVSEEVVK